MAGKLKVMRAGASRPSPRAPTDRARRDLERTVSPALKRAVDASIKQNREALRELEKH